MLKKFGAIVMLLLFIVSFTIGSVEPASESSIKHNRALYLDRMPGDMPLPLLPPLPDVAPSAFIGGDGSGIVRVTGSASGTGVMVTPGRKDCYTSVVLDLSGQRVPSEGDISWHTPDFKPPFVGIHMIPANDHIESNIIVRRAGSNVTSTYPVKFFKHQIPALMGGSPVVSYRANTTIAIDDDNSSYFVFNGEILVMNNSGQDNSMTALDGSYDSEITMGQTVYHQAQVSGASTAFNFDLKWNKPDDDLRLMVYTPDGHVLGPYTDASDGKADGRINMEVDNPKGVADGTWIFKVTGMNITGKDEYYIRTW